MDKESIQDVERLVKQGHIVEVDGQTYSAMSLKPVFNDPRPSELETNTLMALVHYVRDKVEPIEQMRFIHVRDHSEVCLLSEFHGPSKERTLLVKVAMSKALQTFPFGKFMNTEEFIISLRSLFQPSNDFEKVMKFASTVTTDTTVSNMDDGISQAVQVRKGVSGGLKDTVVTNGIVELSPWRTFREVEQPVSEFILRTRPATENTPTTLALFEADGGSWRLKAVENIHAFLRSQDLNLTILS